MKINEVAAQFAFEGTVREVRPFGSGHINSTFLAVCGNGEAEQRYVIQKINTSVFKKPAELMENVFAVTDFLREKIAAGGGDAARETLRFIRTADGGKYFETEEGECYRAYAFVKDSVSYDTADSPALFGKSGAAFGRFQRLLADFPAESLFETIPHFHHTAWRFENEFMPALFAASDAFHRECEKEIAFVTARRGEMARLTETEKAGELPLRVTHNDTKLNNILFDSKTGEALAVIDLDTVMPGLALYDFGDSIRFGAATAAEDEADLSKVKMDLAYFEAYARGYLAEAGDALTNTEKENLAFSAWLMTLECGMRFLTDYLNGNIYFKTDYETHNLVRARNQLALAADMEAKMDAMNKIIRAIQ